ncbi:MAG: N-6 DNA methylase [Candidatus Sumerlaeota bacterium]|nr:N-6 DNA methylase [Candidatus Sumerlaeota bacterium]
MVILNPELRKALEKVVLSARAVAEEGAKAAIEGLAVHEAEPYRHMTPDARELRTRLRAHARQLGDQLHNGRQDIGHLVEECAYEHWHRMLFARFLAENHLLMHPVHKVAITLDECDDLAEMEGAADRWILAGRYAANMLPQVFRPDDPVLQVTFAPNHVKTFKDLLAGLARDVFIAGDSLGWVYQFWQAKKKDDVNKSGKKIGADEICSVTQLFTENYMVDFLLDNTLGAWRAGKVLAASPKLAEKANSEEDVRHAVSLPGVSWNYLRFMKGEDGKWTPAAGSFDGWPKTAKELKCLDPCMGSGHFVVAMFERLLALRMAEEKLGESAAVSAVIRDNLFGLEIDPRCTQIAAFNLALAAWRRVGHCALPAMNLACSGLAPNAKEADWLKIAGGNEKLIRGMEQLYGLFQKAAALGSLINPRAGEGDLLVAAFHELQPLLEKALARETRDNAAHEMAVTASGLAKAAEILAGQFTLVATNVPYLTRSKQEAVLKDYCDREHHEAKADLATCFVERCLDFCAPSGNAALVTPQNWLFLGTYMNLRKRLLRQYEWDLVARLGARAFETIGGEVVNVSIVALSRSKAKPEHKFAGLDVSSQCSIAAKATSLCSDSVNRLGQSGQMKNPDARIAFEEPSNLPLLSKYASGLQGISPADFPHYGRFFWEVCGSNQWEFWQSTIDDTIPFGGRELVLWWNEDLQKAIASGQAYLRGEEAWGKWGVVVRQMCSLPVSLFTGEKFDTNCAVIVPRNQCDLLAIWCYCTSPEYNKDVRAIDQSLKVTNATLVKVPFDLAYWQKVAAEKYPHGLPKPFSSDPTQWLFNGHPKGSDRPLHVAVARLLGYQWPRQTGSSFPDCPTLGPDGLEKLADADGIVCVPSVRGEEPAAERVEAMLKAALGKEWTPAKKAELLAAAGANTLDDWLRDGFFGQHCKLFHNRPFIWHIWDGRRRDGFSALVNYHKLDHKLLERLTYTYLGDWIKRQDDAVKHNESGADARREAARALQHKLSLILEGEPPYDVFVRWKPIHEQAIGWHPDLNDGVRMNIRPFMVEDVLRKRPNIKWDKDRGKEPQGGRAREQFPWFHDARGTFHGERHNDEHLTLDEKRAARKR